VRLLRSKRLHKMRTFLYFRQKYISHEHEEVEILEEDLFTHGMIEILKLKKDKIKRQFRGQSAL
jgi:hypothetical protein